MRWIIDIDANRFDLFSTSAAGNLREIPSSKNALKFHIMQSAYLSGWVWRNTLSASTPPSVLELGWEIVQEEDQFSLKWVKEIPIPEYLMLANVIETCKCNHTKQILRHVYVVGCSISVTLTVMASLFVRNEKFVIL